MSTLIEMLERELAGPDKAVLRSLGFTHTPPPYRPTVDRLALVVCDWLRARGEVDRYDGEDTAPAWAHLWIGSICDEIAMRHNLPAEYAERARTEMVTT